MTTIGDIKLESLLNDHKLRMMQIMGDFNESHFSNHLLEVKKIASQGYAMREVLDGIEKEAARSGRVIYPD